MFREYESYILGQLEKLIAIPSPSGFFAQVQDYLLKEIESLGFKPSVSVKGGFSFCIGGEGEPVVLMAHADTLGAQVKYIKPTGRLMVSRVGGLNPHNTETENVTVHTREHGTVKGTLQLVDASTHVNKNYDVLRSFESNIEVVLDKNVTCAQDTRELGIMNGDFISLEPRFNLATDGYLKSRFLDDKIGVAILLGFAKYVSEKKLKLNRKVYIGITVYEEVLHAGGGFVPADAVELLGIDMGCVGELLDGSEHKVSIVARDNYGPYNYEVISKLVKLCQEKGIDFAVDCYQGYVSDVTVALLAGHDVKHGLIGPGVYASHSYERTNIVAVKGSFNLLAAYLVQQ